jgi:hypothetical protein
MTRGWLGSVLLERGMKYLAVSTYLACIPLANWLISNVGTTCAPNGPCLVPVGFGLLAPSGVLVIGLAQHLCGKSHFSQCIKYTFV